MPFPSPGDLPNTGIKPRSSTLKADSLPIELPKKPKNSVQPIPFSFCIALKLSRDGVGGQMRKVIGSSWVIHMIFFSYLIFIVYHYNFSHLYTAFVDQLISSGMRKMHLCLAILINVHMQGYSLHFSEAWSPLRVV